MSVVAVGTHPIFSGPAIERINKSDSLDRVVVTDTIPLSEEASKCEKIEVASVADVLAQSIHRTFNNDSVSSLFE